VTHPLRNIVRSLLLVVLVVASFSVGSAAAKSKPPCWKTLINDWYDGRIDGTYPIHCYRDALKHLPTDVETYSSARDDIKQALQKRLTQGSKGNETTTTTGGSSSSGPPGTGKNNSGPNGPNSSNPNNSSKTTPVKSVFGAGKSKSADSVPIPLIILGAVALLLMAAGAVGFFARRTRTRRLQLASAAAKQPPQTP
jgi:hypothetical protein